MVGYGSANAILMESPQMKQLESQLDELERKVWRASVRGALALCLAPAWAQLRITRVHAVAAERRGVGWQG
jgi:hypothetical protein